MDIPLLSQNDDRWAWEKLGTSNETIGDYGCLLTCFTMLAGWSNVSAMNDFRVHNNGFYNGSYASTFDLLDTNKQCKFDAVKTNLGARWERVPAPEPEVMRCLDHLKSGNPVILEVNWNLRFRKWLSWAKYDSHFVVVLPDLKVYDPWPSVGDPKQVCQLTPEYGKTWAEAIVRVVYYDALV